ncbi:hypothetical protein BGZ73_006123 [Actinomortierella ambigua]|nr:hypothetical protein BGZ73_006123 [Actinomortierella ambigua]
MSFNYTADVVDVDTLNLAETAFPADASSFSFELGDDHHFSESFGGVPLQQQQLWDDGQLTLPSNTSKLFYNAHSSAENSANNSLSLQHSQAPLQQHQLSHPHLPQHLQPHSRSGSNNHHHFHQQHQTGHQFLGSPLKFQQQEDGHDLDLGQPGQGWQPSPSSTLSAPNIPPEITLSSDNDLEDDQRLLLLSNIGSGKKGDSISLFAKLGDESDLSYDLFKEELDADETRDVSRFIFDQSMMDPTSGNVSSLGPTVRHGLGGGVESLFDQQFPASVSGNHSLTEDHTPLSTSQYGVSTPLLSTGADLDYEEFDKDFLSMLRSKTTTQQSTPIAALAPPPSLMVTSPSSEQLDGLSMPMLGGATGLDSRPQLSEAAKRILEEKANSRPKTKVNEEYQAALKSFRDSLRIADPVRTPHKFGPQPLPILWNAPKLRSRVLPDLNLAGTTQAPPTSYSQQLPSLQSIKDVKSTLGLGQSSSGSGGVGSTMRLSAGTTATPQDPQKQQPQLQQTGKDPQPATSSSSMTSASSVSPRQKLNSRPMSPSTSLSSDALDDVAPLDLPEDVKLLATSPSITATSSPNGLRHWMKTPQSPDTPISTPRENSGVSGSGSGLRAKDTVEPEQHGTIRGTQEKVRPLVSGAASPKAGTEGRSRGSSAASAIGAAGSNTVSSPSGAETLRPDGVSQQSRQRGPLRPDTFQEPSPQAQPQPQQQPSQPQPQPQSQPQPQPQPQSQPQPELQQQQQQQQQPQEQAGEGNDTTRPRSLNILPESLTSINNYHLFHPPASSSATAEQPESPTQSQHGAERRQQQQQPSQEHDELISPVAATTRRRQYSSSGDMVEPTSPSIPLPSTGGRSLAGTIRTRYSRSGSSSSTGSHTETNTPLAGPVNSTAQGSLAGRVRTSQLQEPLTRRTTHHRQSIIDENIFLPPSGGGGPMVDSQQQQLEYESEGGGGPYQDMDHAPPSAAASSRQRSSKLLDPARGLRRLSPPLSAYAGSRQDLQQQSSPTYSRQRQETEDRLSDIYSSPTDAYHHQQQPHESEPGQHSRPQLSQPAAATVSRYQSRLSRPSSLVRRVSDEGGQGGDHHYQQHSPQDYPYDDYGQSPQYQQQPQTPGGSGRKSLLSSPSSRRRPLTTSSLLASTAGPAGGIMNGFNAYQARRTSSISSSQGSGAFYDAAADDYASGPESGLPTPTTPRKTSLTRALDGGGGSDVGVGYRSYAATGHASGHVRTASGSSASGIRRSISGTVAGAAGLGGSSGGRLASMAAATAGGAGLSHSRNPSIGYEQQQQQQQQPLEGDGEEEEYVRVFVPPHRSATLGHAAGQGLQPRTPLTPSRKSSLHYAYEVHDRMAGSGSNVGGSSHHGSAVGYTPVSPSSGLKRYSTISGATGSGARHSIGGNGSGSGVRPHSIQSLALPPLPPAGSQGQQQQDYYEDDYHHQQPMQPSPAAVRRTLSTMMPSSMAGSASGSISGIPGVRRPSSHSLKRATVMDLPMAGGSTGLPRPNMPPLRTASGSSASSGTSLNSPLSAGSGAAGGFGGVGHRPSTLGHYQQGSASPPTRLQQPMATISGAGSGGSASRRSMIPSMGGGMGGGGLSALTRGEYFNSPSRRSSGSSLVYGGGSVGRRGSNNSTTAEVNAYSGNYYHDEQQPLAGGGGYRQHHSVQQHHQQQQHQHADYGMHAAPEPVLAGGRRQYRTSYR